MYTGLESRRVCLLKGTHSRQFKINAGSEQLKYMFYSTRPAMCCTRCLVLRFICNTSVDNDFKITRTGTTAIRLNA